MEYNKEIEAIKNIKMTNEEKEQILSNIFSIPTTSKPTKSPFSFVSVLWTNNFAFYAVILCLIMLGGALSSNYIRKDNKNYIAKNYETNPKETSNTKHNETINENYNSEEKKIVAVYIPPKNEEPQLQKNTSIESNTQNVSTPNAATTSEPTKTSSLMVSTTNENNTKTTTLLKQEFTLLENKKVPIGNTGLEIMISKFSSSACSTNCSSSPSGINFEYYFNGKIESGDSLTQAFGYRITILDTDHKTYAKIIVDKLK